MKRNHGIFTYIFQDSAKKVENVVENMLMLKRGGNGKQTAEVGTNKRKQD